MRVSWRVMFASHPQGGVISPLLANRYMNRFLRHWRNQGRGEAYRAHVVNYADDFVILSRGYAEEALAWTRQVMTKRNEDGGAQCTVGTLRLPGLQLRTALLPEGRPLVSGREPVTEERATPQVARGGDHGPLQCCSLGRSAHPAEQSPAWLGDVFRLRHAVDGLPGGRPPCLRGGSRFPDAAP